MLTNDDPAAPATDSLQGGTEVARLRAERARQRRGGRVLGLPPTGSSGEDSVDAVSDDSVGSLEYLRGGNLDNTLVVGDNVHALAEIARDARHSCDALVKIAYLDPPYNTGVRFGHYDDALDSSVWLSKLRIRLELVKQALHPEGSVWLHLDDSEQHRGRILMDEVFGNDAFVATVVWQRRTSRESRTAFSVSHDYIHVYAPSGPKRWRLSRNGLPNDGAFANPDNDPLGPWRSIPMSVQAGHGTAAQFYKITTPNGEQYDPPDGRCWTYSASRFQQLVEEGRVYWPRGGSGRPRLKRYVDEVSPLSPSTIWLADEVGDNAAAKKELLRAVPGMAPFDTPKPESLMERIFHIGSNEGDLVLDPYIGSGTSAVVAARMDRRWVGVEENRNTVNRFTIPRIEREVGSAGFAIARAHPGFNEGAGLQ